VLLLGSFVLLATRHLWWAAAISTALGLWFSWIAAYTPPGLVPEHLNRAIVVLPVLGVLTAALLVRLVGMRTCAYGLAALICLLFVYRAAHEVSFVHAKLGDEPRPLTYAYDPHFFIRTFYLVDTHALGYYEASGLASREDARYHQPTSNLAGWRTPALTWLWSLLFDSSVQIIWGFIVIAAGTMVLAYLLTARLADEVTALVVPALLCAYNLAAMYSLHFLAYEVWAAFFALGAAVLVTWRRDRAGLLFAMVAALIREWFISALLAGIAGHLLRRRPKAAALWALGLVVVAGLIALNVLRAREYLLAAGVEPTGGAGYRLRGGPLFVLYTLQFNARFYAQTYVLPHLLLALGLVGCVPLLRRRETFVPGLILVPVALFMVTGFDYRPGDAYGMGVYYSGAFLPFAMISACCARQLCERPPPPGAGSG